MLTAARVGSTERFTRQLQEQELVLVERAVFVSYSCHSTCQLTGARDLASRYEQGPQ